MIYPESNARAEPERRIGGEGSRPLCNNWGQVLDLTQIFHIPSGNSYVHKIFPLGQPQPTTASPPPPLEKIPRSALDRRESPPLHIGVILLWYSMFSVRDFCKFKPCFPGVPCFNDPYSDQGFECGDCPLGMEGNGVNCTDIDEVCSLLLKIQPNWHILSTVKTYEVVITLETVQLRKTWDFARYDCFRACR